MLTAEKQDLFFFLQARPKTLHLTLKTSHKTFNPSLGGHAPTSPAGLTDSP